MCQRVLWHMEFLPPLLIILFGRLYGSLLFWYWQNSSTLHNDYHTTRDYGKATLSWNIVNQPLSHLIPTSMSKTYIWTLCLHYLIAFFVLLKTILITCKILLYIKNLSKVAAPQQILYMIKNLLHRNWWQTYDTTPCCDGEGGTWWLKTIWDGWRK